VDLVADMEQVPLDRPRRGRVIGLVFDVIGKIGPAVGLFYLIVASAIG
jgi:hypothetical protein